MAKHINAVIVIGIDARVAKLEAINIQVIFTLFYTGAGFT